eukprot:scaffold100917_cov37-Prasinocladus_malaysianus.AAC.1
MHGAAGTAKVALILASKALEEMVPVEGLCVYCMSARPALAMLQLGRSSQIWMHHLPALEEL